MDFLESQTSKVPLGDKPPGSGNARNLSSTSTDGIDSQQRPAPAHDTSASSELAADPSGSGLRLSSVSDVSLPFIFLSPSVDGDAGVTNRATITIRLLDVHHPVLVWTSLNSWEAPLAMVAHGTDPAGRRTYTCQLDDVPEQLYQYKVQVGDEWVVDDDMPITQDQAGNVNNVGYTEHISREPASGSSRDIVAAENRGAVHYDSQRADSQNIRPLPVYNPPLRTGHAQKGLPPNTSDAAVAQDARDGDEDAQHHVGPGTEAEQQAPLLRHESYQMEPKSNGNADDLRRNSRPQPLPLSIIEEEAVTTSNDGEPESQPATPSSLEQAREYQRALIEAMPASIADGFTRASVLVTVRSPHGPSEVSNAPPIQYETIYEPMSPGVQHLPGEQDELLHAPLMRHETDPGYVNDTQPQDPGELEQAPLMLHETNMASSSTNGPNGSNQTSLMQSATAAVSPEDESLDELDQASLFRFENTLDADTANADAPGLRLSYGTTLVGDYDDFAHAPLSGYVIGPSRFDDSEPSSESSFSSERMMFTMDTSNPPSLVGPHRSSSVYSSNGNEIDRVSTLPHESPQDLIDEACWRNWIIPRAAPSDSEGVTYYRAEEASDAGGVGELDQAPAMSHEADDSLSPSNLRLDELEGCPMLSHEAGTSGQKSILAGSDGASSERRAIVCNDTDTASERSEYRHVDTGEDDLLSTSKTNSFTSERLREAFRTSIFGATRRLKYSPDSSGENELDFGGAPLLAHEQTEPLHDHTSRDSVSSKGGGWRQRTNVIPDFATFAMRTGTSSSYFRSQMSNLPHNMLRSDDDDLGVRSPSLEIFHMDTDEAFGRAREFSTRLPSLADDFRAPAVLSHSGSFVDLTPVRPPSTMSMESIQEDATEGDYHPNLLPSPMLASRVPKLPSASSPIQIPKGEDMVTPMPRYDQYGYFGSRDRIAMLERDAHATAPAARRRVPIKQRTRMIHEEDEDPDDVISKRYGRIFDSIAFPPTPPPANIPFPPKSSSSSSSTVSLIEPNDADANDAKRRFRTSHPHGNPSDGEGDEGSNIARKICAHFRACFPSRNAR